MADHKSKSTTTKLPRITMPLLAELEGRLEKELQVSVTHGEAITLAIRESLEKRGYIDNRPIKLRSK